MAALYTVCGPFLVNWKSPLLLTVMCGNIALCAAVWLLLGLQEALLWLVNLDLATVGFFLHYRSLFRLSTFKPENIGCWLVPSLFLLGKAYTISEVLFCVLAGSFLLIFTSRFTREITISRHVKAWQEGGLHPKSDPKAKGLTRSVAVGDAANALLSGQAIVESSSATFKATRPVTHDMPREGAVFRFFVFFHSEGPNRTRVWGIRRSTGFFFSPRCALTVLHVRPTYPNSTIVAMVGTNDLAARFEDIYPHLTADLQDGLRHHLPNSVQHKDLPDLELFWFRAAFDLEDEIRAALQDIAAELGLPTEDLHPYRVSHEDVEEVGQRAAQGDPGPGEADFYTKADPSDASTLSSRWTWPQFCDVVLLRCTSSSREVMPLDAQYCTAPTNMLLSMPACVYGYPASSVFREHYRNVLTQFTNLAKRSILMQCFCYYTKKVSSEGTAWLPPALTPETRIADTRDMPHLIAKCPEVVKEYHRQLGFVSCSAELEMAGGPICVNGTALGVHVGCVPVENRNLFLFVHHPMLVVYLYLRCHQEEELRNYFQGHVRLLGRVVSCTAWYELQDVHERLRDMDL
eukprot:GGOE01002421.1.p1 GENE.GGOE01002421.1~~GGOE01002421.1.p1  ORF type:complete len:574 (-),score=177.56 GGOE01002421.1:530-2251(-)